MPTPRPSSLHSKVLAFVPASTLASCLVVSWIAIASQHADLHERLGEQYPRALAQQEAMLRTQLESTGLSLEDAARGKGAREQLDHAFAVASNEHLLGLELVDDSGHRIAGQLEPRPTPSLLASKLGGLAKPLNLPAPGDTLVAVARQIAGTSAYLLGGVAREQAHAPLQRVAQRILAANACLVLLFTLLAQRVTRQILAPVHALSEAARRVSLGDLDVEIELPTHHRGNELGLLARTFEHMLRRLRTNQREIEHSNAELRESNEELKRANEVLSQLSITDGLTKLHNHRFFQDLLGREVKRADRNAVPLTLMLIDIDDFKKLNDHYGHAAGDQILKNLARLLTESVRETDVLARYGGEEFVVLSPNTDLEGATILAEKIRLTIEQSAFTIDEALEPLLLSVSIGVAQYEGNAKRFFRVADAALYRAKDQGKNCVVRADNDDGATWPRTHLG
ncbi:MAG: diguanylate cyclase [Myxococcota bacterium]|nr:diguanylate cyclase [Myxococcota bacterium]